MKFFADFTPFSARYCDIADAAWKAEYGLWAIDSKQHLAENRLFRQSEMADRLPSFFIPYEPGRQSPASSAWKAGSKERPAAPKDLYHCQTFQKTW